MITVVEIFVGMLICVVMLALLARRFHVPYPVFFVIGGTLIGFVPELPKVTLNPQWIFLLVLPPLLYPAALFTSWRDFRANLRPISLLAIGLVLFTTIVVAYLAEYFFHLPLAAGFVLGAIISPPDAVAATAIAEHLRVPRRIITILEGESLVNDATALVAYRLAVAAVVTGGFSWFQAGAEFLVIGACGILAGLLVGWLAEQFHRRVDDAPIEITFSLLTPYAAYLLAEHYQVSGVLAVVSAGVYLGWRAPEITSYRTRLRGGPVWEMITFLLNGFVFILIGLELPQILHRLAEDRLPVQTLIWDAVVITLAAIAIRILWVVPVAYLPRLLFRNLCRHDLAPQWQQVAVVAWTGMRGVVSLAAALALPTQDGWGKPFPGRDLILFLTLVIIFATLIFQGLSLPVLIRWLGVKDDGAFEKEEREARLLANQTALGSLPQTADGEPARKEALHRLRAEYEDFVAQLQSADGKKAGGPVSLFSSQYQVLSRDALQVERHTILQLRNQGTISDDVLRRIQRDIDLAEARLHV